MPAINADLICFSHLRWGFVFQRPQHLMSRFAQTGRVFFLEEPWQHDGEPRLDVIVDPETGVTVGVPHVPSGLSEDQLNQLQKGFVDELIAKCAIHDYVAWYYTPMAVGFTKNLTPSAVVYDCMDELTLFKDAPPALRENERELFRRADLVFTGGQSLFESKQNQHSAVYAFPSSVDVQHFAQARQPVADPADQAGIPHPRIGYIGVIDERLDLDLIAGVADLRPEWHLVIIGPVMKIEEESLPKRPNIHYLGGKSYKELPQYLAGWDAAMLPFARNDATRFISPTKTPEYLAAGLPSISTSIRDVVRPYGEMKLVEIADTPQDFAAALDRLTAFDKTAWIERVDEFLKRNSWDITWEEMAELISTRIHKSKDEVILTGEV